jgi:putative NADPH-quinone reductase
LLLCTAATHLPAGAEQQWLRLSELDLPPFADIRHSGEGIYPQPQGDAALLLDATLAATDIVMVAPLYWYSLPALAKAYLDHWSGWMRVPGLEFRARMAGKRMWDITSMSDEDTAYAQPLVDALRHSAAYMEMHWQKALIGYGNRPGDVRENEKAMQEARNFFA